MTDATREEVLQSLLCCHADLCRMEGRTKDREHDIVASVSRAVSNAIVDLAAPEEEDCDPYNTGMHDEYDLDENGRVKAIHTCENEPKPEPTPPRETNYERWMRTKYRRDFHPEPGRYYDCGNCPASTFSFKKPLGEAGCGCANCFFWWGMDTAEDEQWKGKD